MVFDFFGYGVIAARAPGVTTANSLRTEPHAFEYAPFLYGFDGVLRTGGGVAAMRTKERGNTQLVESYRQYEQLLKQCQ